MNDSKFSVIATKPKLIRSYFNFNTKTNFNEKPPPFVKLSSPFTCIRCLLRPRIICIV